MSHRTIATVLVVAALGACSTTAHTAKSPETTQLPVNCPKPTTEEAKNAWYVGPYRGYENDLTPSDFARDFYCANKFKSENYPNGFVTIYGSSSIKERDSQGTEVPIYAQIMAFSEAWTRQWGRAYPIMTGAGPGLMEAASRGASKAGKSIGYTTYYDPPKPGSTLPHGGEESKAFWKYGDETITSQGLIFSSVDAREDAMILHSAAIIIAPGGMGTEWETFQILETIKSRQLREVPVYVVGNKALYWQSLIDRLCDMYRHQTLTPDNLKSLKFVEYVENPQDLVPKLKARLIDKTTPEQNPLTCPAR